MINNSPPTPRDAERTLVLAYAPAAARSGLAALFALDDTLGAILRTTREPLVGQMRLTWWYEALERLDTQPPPAEPILQALAETVVPQVCGAALAPLVDGWEALLDPALDTGAIDAFAVERGGRLFDVAGRLCGVTDARFAVAGQGWALADLSRHVSDPAVATPVRARALERLDEGLRGRWPRGARALGAMALLARDDLRGGNATRAPRRIGRILIHRLSGF